MSPSPVSILDGNEAVARGAYKLSEVIALHPITPATPMGERADAWAAAGERAYQYLAARPPARAVETAAETKP